MSTYSAASSEIASLRDDFFKESQDLVNKFKAETPPEEIAKAWGELVEKYLPKIDIFRKKYQENPQIEDLISQFTYRFHIQSVSTPLYISNLKFNAPVDIQNSLNVYFSKCDFNHGISVYAGNFVEFSSCPIAHKISIKGFKSSLNFKGCFFNEGCLVVEGVNTVHISSSTEDLGKKSHLIVEKMPARIFRAEQQTFSLLKMLPNLGATGPLEERAASTEQIIFYECDFDELYMENFPEKLLLTLSKCKFQKTPPSVLGTLGLHQKSDFNECHYPAPQEQHTLIYRDLANKFRENKNEEMAYKFKGFELASRAKRPKDLEMRALLGLYCWASNYGQSPLQPLWRIISILFIFWAGLLLNANQECGQFGKTGIIALETALGPAKLFLHQSHLSDSDGYLIIAISHFLSIVCSVLWFLLVIGIRTRLKL